METSASKAPEVLATSECWRLLREAVVGRLAVLVHDSPEIFPVNFLVDHGSIVFRTAEGTKLSAAVNSLVAFEVDAFDASSGEAWSVVAKGTAREIVRLYDVIDAAELPLFPWHAAPKQRLVRIEPDVVSGRRFHAATRNPARSTQPRRHSAPE